MYIGSNKFLDQILHGLFAKTGVDLSAALAASYEALHGKTIPEVTPADLEHLVSLARPTFKALGMSDEQIDALIAQAVENAKKEYEQALETKTEYEDKIAELRGTITQKEANITALIGDLGVKNSRIAALEAQLDAEHRFADEYRNERDKLQDEVNTLNETLRQEKAVVEELKKNLADLQERYEDADLKLQEANQTIGSLKAVNDTLNRNYEIQSEQLQKANVKFAEAQDALDRANELIAALQGDGADAAQKIADLQQDLKDTAEARDNLSLKLANSQNALMEARENLDALKSNLSEANAELADLKNTNSNLAESLQVAEDRVAELEEQYSVALESLNRTSKELALIKESLENSDKDSLDQRAIVAELRGQISELQSQVSEKDSVIESKEEEIAGLRAALERAKRKIHELEHAPHHHGCDPHCPHGPFDPHKPPMPPAHPVEDDHHTDLHAQIAALHAEISRLRQSRDELQEKLMRRADTENDDLFMNTPLGPLPCNPVGMRKLCDALKKATAELERLKK